MKKKNTEHNCNVAHNHPSHIAEIPRINKAIGQLEGIKKMIEELRYCPDILIQLKAVRAAIKSVESNILKTHLETCVKQSFFDKENVDKKIQEIKDLFDKFQT